MKEQTRSTEIQINEEEIEKLPEKEFRKMTANMIKNLENKMDKMQESINKHLEELKNKHTETNKEEDITIVNIYAPNTGAPQYIRQTLTAIKGETDSNTIIVGDFNTPLTPVDRSSKQKINKETQVLNDIFDKVDLIGIFRMFHPNAEYTFFSSAHGTCSRIDHILGHKSNFSKFEKLYQASSLTTML